MVRLEIGNLHKAANRREIINTILTRLDTARAIKVEEKDEEKEEEEEEEEYI